MLQHSGPISENIGLLSLFSPTGKLEPKVAYPTPQERRDSVQPSDYVLSLKHERQCAEAFAIVMADTDDPDHIGAVCVQEMPGGKGLKIRIASNSGSHPGRVAGLQSVADKLKEASTLGETGHQVQGVLKEMIIALQTRLLGRLGSRHAPPPSCKRPRSTKRPVLQKLEDAHLLLKKLGSQSEQSDLFYRLSESLAHRFAALERLSTSDARSEKGRASIHEILLEIEDLFRSVDLKSVLSPIPSNVDSWRDDARGVLIRRLEKLRQHVPAARDLIRVACRHSIFRSIDVEELRTFPDRRQCAEPVSVQKGVLRRYMTDEKKLHVVESRLGKPLHEINNCVGKCTRAKKRVHAEIQLLLYYQQHPEIEKPPRVLCSSKHACFLCDLFIKTHKGFHVPGSHGKFYPKWRIPTVGELNLPKKPRAKFLKCLEDFNKKLELKIQEYLQKGPAKIPDPLESIIYNPGSVTPSVASRLEKVDVGEPKETTLALESLEPRESPQAPLPSETASSPGFASNCSSATVQSLDAPPSALIAPALATALPYSSDPRSFATGRGLGLNGPENPYQMRFGTPVSVALFPGSSARFHTSSIHMELSYDDASSIASSISSSAPISRAHDSTIRVWVEWVDSASCATETLFDLSMQWTYKNVPRDDAFGELGFALRKGDEILVLRAIAGTDRV